MARENLALLRHREQGRSVYLVHRLPKTVEGPRLHRRLSRFEVGSEWAYRTVGAPDASGSMRTVIVSRLTAGCANHLRALGHDVSAAQVPGLCASLCIEVVWQTPEGAFVSSHN